MSLSLYIYIYIHTYIHMYTFAAQSDARADDHLIALPPRGLCN